jgi:hypothetical protein
MGPEIIGLLVALIPVAVTLLNLWLKKRTDPNEIRKRAQMDTDGAIARHDADAVNRTLNDELRRLQAKGHRDSGGQNGDATAGR